VKGNGAVVVAHPDDETLWAGGLIASSENVTVICCTVPRKDPERALKFFDAVRVLGGYPVLVPFVEPSPLEDIDHLDVLQLSGFDWIATHNANGEYGHRHHKNVHEWVKSDADCPVFTFGHGQDCGDHVIDLTGDYGAAKFAALECYDSYSPADSGLPKWVALMNTYDIDRKREVYCAEC